MNSEEIIRLITVLLGSSLSGTVITSLINRKQVADRVDAELRKLRVEAKSLEKQSDGDYVGSLLESSGELDKRRNELVEQIKAELDDEKAKSELLEKRINECERLIVELKAKLSESARYRTFFNVMNHPALFINAETGEIIDVNIRALDLYGYSRDEMLKTSFYELLSRREDIKQIREGNNHILSVYQKTQDKSTFSSDLRISYFAEETRRLAVVTIIERGKIALKDRVIDYLENIRSDFNTSYATVWKLHNGVYDENGQPLYQVSVLYEVYKSGLRYLGDMFQNMPLTMFDPLEKMLNGQSYAVVNVDDPEKNAISGALKHSKLGTIVIVPVHDKEKRVMGFVTVSFSAKTEIKNELIAKLIEASTSDIIRGVLAKKNP